MHLSHCCLFYCTLAAPISTFPVDPPLIHPVIPAAPPNEVPGANLRIDFIRVSLFMKYLTATFCYII